MVWLVMAVMTGFAALIALWPLVKRQPRPASTADEAAFYRAQLDEIQRDVDRGALPADEAASAHAEAARRLIAASEATTAPAPVVGAARRVALVAIAAFLPIAAFGVYLALGHPDALDAPLATRNVDMNQPGGIELAIARIEDKLAGNPDDVRAWTVLAPVYMRLGRYDDAATAFKQLLRLRGDDAELWANLGEATLAAAGGAVTADAHADFERALKLSPDMPMARFYLALAVEQDGDKAKALAIYRELEPKTDGSAAWMLGLKNRLSALDGAPTKAPQFSAEQQAMIQQMVQALAKRLADVGGSADEWARLIRAYSVLHHNGEAQTALADARKAFPNDATTLGRFDALARELGL